MKPLTKDKDSLDRHLNHLNDVPFPSPLVLTFALALAHHRCTG